MKSLILILLFFLGGLSCSINKMHPAYQSKNSEYKWLWTWINSWDYISKEIFNLPNSTPPKMLFYDNEYVYTNSEISAPNGIIINGPKLYNKKISWKKQLHNDTLILPTGAKAPIQLMTFAAPLKEGSFFVMPAPEYWGKFRLKNDIVTTEKMLTGIFIHEFAHTRQIETINRKIMDFTKKGVYAYPVNDDIIQNYFKDNKTYFTEFTQESDCIYDLVNRIESKNLKENASYCITTLKKRQQKYFLSISANLIEMDNVFLTIEGIGQYAMLAYYMSKQGCNLEFAKALTATRHNKKWWSQEEGLALILLYVKLKKDINWEDLFKNTNSNIVELIENEI